MTLYSIDLKHNDWDDPDHVEIELVWSGYEDETATDAEAFAAGKYVVGLLARVACEASLWIDLERQEHHCLKPQVELLAPDRPARAPVAHCEVDTFGLLTVVEPFVSFTVPRDRRTDWLARIESWLDQLDDIERSTTWDNEPPDEATELRLVAAH